jgi:hypothetical protein
MCLPHAFLMAALLVSKQGPVQYVCHALRAIGIVVGYFDMDDTGICKRVPIAPARPIFFSNNRQVTNSPTVEGRTVDFLRCHKFRAYSFSTAT